MDRKRTVHFNAPGFKSQEVEIAPDIDPIHSKRKHLIAEEVIYMTARSFHNFFGYVVSAGSKFGYKYT